MPGGPAWFKTVLRFWLLRRRHTVPSGSPAAVALSLSLAWLAAWCGIDWWERQPQPVFYPDGIPVLAWYGLAVIGLSALLWRCRSSRPPALAPLPVPSPPPLASFVVLTTGLVPLPLLLVTFGAVFLEARWFWAAAAAVGMYVLLYLGRGLHVLTGRPQRAAALLGTGCVVLFAVLSNVTNAIPDVWNPQDTTMGISDQELADREAALFEQSARIDQALDSVTRDVSPRPQAFFLGFAGVGDEKVFAQEIALASRVIGERYRTGNRQLSLVNDERDLDAAPLASVTGLGYALQGLADRMQTDRDVLILAISSHGSGDPAIAVANSQFPLVDLTPDDLLDALQQAGIRWRVILLSACYAGGFIEPLRDDHTIVIAAAAPDRTSFGCSSDSDLTYFGEAFYRDALPDAGSLQDAFEKARAAIAAREHAEGETPSNPQAYFGFDLEAHMATRPGASLARVAAPSRQLR